MQKHYIVAGSSSGIGAELTQKLLSKGYKVTGISRSEVAGFQMTIPIFKPILQIQTPLFQK
ncbi:MAG: hypothetical protein IPG53_20815 [Ignavibacteriales bacterium]|nr:hypothetical protein [Ignavibacteriales bacterium]